MTHPRDLNVSVADGGTSFVVYDASSGATRRCDIDSVSEYVIKQIPAGTGASVVSGTYANGTLTLHMSYGPDIVITGWADLGGITFDGNEVDSISFNGGLEGKYNAQTKALSVDMISNQAIGNYFLGIYPDLASLQAAVRNPKDNYQAIILSPDEEYYHVVAGQWVELAPVVNVHPSYIGAFDTESDLNAAGGSAENGSLAIVGTTDHTFYVKKAGAWTAIKGADLPSLVGRVAALESWKAQQLTFNSGVTSDLTDKASEIAAIDAQLATKISGIQIEDEANNTIQNAKTISLVGIEIESQVGSSAVLRAKETITVSNGSDPVNNVTEKGGSVEFPGATITTRDNGNIVVVTMPPGASKIKIQNEGGQEYDASKIIFPTAPIYEGQDAGVYVIDTAMGVSDNAGHSVQDVVELKFPDFLVSEQQIDANRRRAVINKMPNPVEQPSAYLAFVGQRTPIPNIPDPNQPLRSIIHPDDVCYVTDKGAVTEIGGGKVGVAGSPASPVDVLIAANINLIGTAQGSGFIKLYISDETDSIISDHAGVEMSSEHMYSQGDVLGNIRLTGVCTFDTDKVLSLVLETDLDGTMIVISGKSDKASGLLVQELSDNVHAYIPLQQFTYDTGERITFAKKTLGNRFANIDAATVGDLPVVTLDVGGTFVTADNYFVFADNKAKFIVHDSLIDFFNTESRPLDFAFGTILSTEDTRALAGKTITTNLTTQSQIAWNVGLVGWTGAPNKAVYEMYSVSNDTIQWENGWELIDHDQVASGIPSDHMSLFDVPATGYNQVAVVLYPDTFNTNTFVKVSKFDLSVSTAVYNYVFANSAAIGEYPNVIADEDIRLVQDNQGTTLLTYPINQAETPLPIGKIVTGGPDIAPAPGVNPQPSGQPKDGEGGLEFTLDGVVSFEGTRLLIRNESVSESTVVVKYKVKHQDDTIEEISDSVTTFTVRANNGSGQYFGMKPFRWHCAPNDVLFLVASSSVGPEVSLQSINSVAPLLTCSMIYRKTMPEAYSSVTIEPYAFGIAQVDTVDTKYAPASANVVATVPVNTVFKSSTAGDNVVFDSATDSVKVGTTGLLKMDYKAHIIRTQQWNAAVKYALWVEKSEDDGAVWHKVDGSVSRVNIPADYPATAIPLTVTFPTEITVANTMFRIRHIADTIVNGVGLQSYAASGDFPAAASIQLTGTKV